jgi:hypothetical protein
MEPWTYFYASPVRTGMGKSFPKSLKHDACPTSDVLYGESTNDVSTDAKSLRWSGPWFLPEPGPAAKLFLATWCQSNSRTLFPRLSAATQTTIPGDVTLSIFDKVVK